MAKGETTMVNGGSAKRFLSGQTFMGLANSIYVMLMSGWCLLVGALPLTLVLLLIHDLRYWPTYVAAMALSAPGFAALFAVFRDHPSLFARNAAVRAKVLEDASDDSDFPPAWIARPYVPVDTSVAVIRPYFRAYARVFARSLAAGVTFGVLAFLFLYDVQIMLKLQPYGVCVVPLLLVLTAMAVQSMLVALVLVVEYPKARYRSVVKNGVLLCVRRIWVTILTAALALAYWWGVVQAPLMVVMLGTGLIAYLLWASTQWQARGMFEAMAAESGDGRIMRMYGVEGRVAKTRAFSGFFSGTRDYRQ